MLCSSNLCASVVKINEINKYRTQMTWMALDRARCIILIKTYICNFALRKNYRNQVAFWFFFLFFPLGGWGGEGKDDFFPYLY